MRVPAWLLAGAVATATASCARAPLPFTVGGVDAPLPPECALRPVDDGMAPWERSRAFLCEAARAPDGGVVTLDYSRLRAFDPGGRLRWDIDYEAGHRCGAPEGLAVGHDGEIVVACGYSLLAFGRDGSFQWQVWPAGDHHVSAPRVDRRGRIFVASAGRLIALDPGGAQRWDVDTGFNRYIPRLAATGDGALLFRTMMDAAHSPDVDGWHVYYDDEPPELFVVDRDGRLLRRVPWAEVDPIRIDWVDLDGERGGRLPDPVSPPP